MWEVLLKQPVSRILKVWFKCQCFQFRAGSDLFRIHVEFLPPHGDLFVSLCGFAATIKTETPITSQLRVRCCQLAFVQLVCGFIQVYLILCQQWIEEMTSFKDLLQTQMCLPQFNPSCSHLGKQIPFKLQLFSKTHFACAPQGNFHLWALTLGLLCTTNSPNPSAAAPETHTHQHTHKYTALKTQPHSTSSTNHMKDWTQTV